MPVSGRVLEDSIRLSRIRRIKIMLYLVQVVLLISMAFVFTFILGVATLKPLFVPLDTFTAIIVLLLLIVCVESFFFRVLEIRFARSSSARHLMAKNSIRRSLAIAIVTGVLAIILAVPVVLGSIEKSTNREITLSPATSQSSFYSSDPFSWTSVQDLEVTSAKSVNLYLVEESVFLTYVGNMTALFTLKLNTDDYAINHTVIVPVPNVAYTKFYIVLDDAMNPGVGATVIVERTLSNTISGMVGLLMIGFVAANLAWVVYLMPIERKYSVSSIYR